jgi:O-antigen/teichoic acid export membrane protein
MTEIDTPRNMEKELLGKSIFYSFSLYVRIFVKVLSGVIVAKLLGPSLFGLKNAYDLARDYESNSDLGVFDALNRLAPYYRGEKKYEKARVAIASVWGVNLYYALMAAAIMVIVSQYLRYNGYEQKYVDFTLFLGVMILTGKMHGFLQTKFKIDHKFYELGINQLIYGFTASILSVVFVYFWGFRGLLISLVVVDVVCIGHLIAKEKKFPEVTISLALYWQVLKVGFPMMVLFLLLMLLINADRTLILAMISEKALGYFGIATVAAGLVTTIPGAIHSVTLAPVMEKLGRTKDSLSIKHYLSEPMAIMAYLLPLIISCIVFAIHLPIKYYLDQYIPSIQVVKILMIGVYFEAVAYPALSVCLAMNKQLHLICIVIPLVALNYSLNYAFITLGWGINGVAAGTSITFFVCFCTILYFASVLFGERLKTYFDNVLMILLPFLYSFVLIFCIETFMDFTIHNMWFDLIISATKVAVFMFLYCVMIYRIRNNSGFVKLYSNLRLFGGQFKSRFSRERPL